jgi:hypothetical protein
MRLKIQKQSELNFVSRIIQSRLIGTGNYPVREARRGKSYPLALGVGSIGNAILYVKKILAASGKVCNFPPVFELNFIFCPQQNC